MWREAVFAFDANILLNIYRYTQMTRDGFFQVLAGLSDRIWIPHQAAAEFQDRRLGVISKQEKAYAEVKELLDDAQKRIHNGLNSYRKHTYLDDLQLEKSLEEVFEKTRKALEDVRAKHPNYLAVDPLRDTITSLFEGKVGNRYATERLEELYREAEKRLTSLPPVPPGYEDKKKPSPRKYGDVIIWFQLLDYAKATKKPLFIALTKRRKTGGLSMKVRLLDQDLNSFRK